MPIGLGLASSHNTWILMDDVEEWQDAYLATIRGKPQPAAAALETPTVLHEYVQRVQHALSTLRSQLTAYDPDLLIIIGGDQTEMFDRSNVPNLMMYIGHEAWGHTLKRTAEPTEANRHSFHIDVETSRWLLRKLVADEGFEVAISDEFEPQAGRGRGISHAFARPAPMIWPREDLPTVLIWENTYDPPSLSAERCYRLGNTLARLLRDDPRRIAILGSGGLSHDPGGPRSGWIDEPLDRWFLSQLAAGNGAATTAMYTFDSLTMRSGTGEMRAWVTAAGAMEGTGSRAIVVDYIPAHHTVTGLGFAYWPTVHQ